MSRNLTTVLFGVVVACAAVSALCERASAADAVLSELYGQGVHNYFASRYHEAEDSFSAAVKQGTQDPRCYYFRGLTFIRLGRAEEAKKDFEKRRSIRSNRAR